MSDDTERRITRQWMDAEAEYLYWLERWHPAVKSTEKAYWLKSSSGDLVWALRIAAHYNLTIPKDEA